MRRSGIWNGFFAVLLLSFWLGVPAWAAGEQVIAHSASALSDPVFSPDSKTLAWIDGDTLMVRDLAASSAKSVVSGLGELRSPSFSGDGKALYFCARKTGNFDLMRLDLESGKTRALAETPEDEFFVQCTHDEFSLEYEPATGAKYFKLLFLRGKDGTGTLIESRDDGSSPVARANISARSLSIGKEGSRLLLSTPSGMQVAEWIPSYDTAMLAVDAPADPVPATGGAGLSDAVFAADGRHFLARRGEEAVVGQLGSATLSSLTTGVMSRPAVDPQGRIWALIKKAGSEFQLVTMSVTKAEAGIVNGYKWPEGKLETLVQAGSQSFIVTPASWKQFGFLYEHNRYNWRESFITTDSILFLFHLFYDSMLKTIERGTFRDGMFEVAGAMAEEARKASLAAKNPKAKELFLRWWGFFSVAGALREDGKEAALALAKKAPPAVREAALEDVERVFEAGARVPSAILGRDVDFSQFKVRGHYEGGPALATYFRLMMWFSQVPLKVFEPGTQKPSTDLPMILSLYYLGQGAKTSGKSVLQRLAELNSPLEYLVGETEDIGVVALQKVLDGKIRISGPDAVVGEDQVSAAFAALSGCAKPRIRPQDSVQVMFFPQRFTLDSYAMQRLVYKAVGTPDNMRLLPNMLDVMASLGSKRAEKILLEVLNEGRYKNYKEHLTALKTEFSSFPKTAWEANLYLGWLRGLGDLVTVDSASLPAFARSEAWLDRMLNTALGSLTTLKHDTLLYSKQGAAEAGEGGEEYLVRRLPETLVDPYPELFSRLRRLTLELYSKMSAQGFLPKPDPKKQEENSYDDILSSDAKGLTLRLIKLLDMLEQVSRKQIAGTSLSGSEAAELFGFGRVLEHMTLALLSEDGDVGNINNEEVALVADVFTGDGTCLEMAIGRVFELWVRHESPSGQKVFQGGVFSYFEFAHPVGNRLSDKEWRKMIRENKAPAQPGWVSSFVHGKPMVEPEPDESDLESH